MTLSLFSNYPVDYSGVNSISVMPSSEVGFDRAYFSGFRCSRKLWESWAKSQFTSDGTASGTVMLSDLFLRQYGLTMPNGGSNCGFRWEST